MRLESRIEKLEASMAGQAEEYEDRAGYRDHVTYCVLDDCRVLSVPELEYHQDERAFHGRFPQGTKFLRLGTDGTHEVVDGVSKPVRCKPLVLAPDARRAMDELHRDITGEWPDQTKEATL